MMTVVDLQGEGFGQSVERDSLWGLLLLGLCVLSVVEGLVVQGLGFLLLRCTLLKMRSLCLKWWATRVAPRELAWSFVTVQLDGS